MIRAIIIDDEAGAREGLQLLLEEYCQQVKVEACCDGAVQGLKAIKSLQPDLVFLDIQMPHMSGFDLLECLDTIDFEVIFVTSYDRYAIKAIKFSALDYLLKPIDAEDLMAAVEKVNHKQQKEKHRYQTLLANMRQGSEKLTRLAIPTENEIIIQKVDDIVYCAADGSYCHVHLADQSKVTVAKNLKDFENILSEGDFYRIHNSTLVNIGYVNKYVRGEGGYVVLKNGEHLDVSRRKKEGLLELLNKV
ncbi:MAG: LytTR family DNA-binding domain-containing protein [Cyclobacteriaceae bacterium]|nr:LytTR family DNA-binding domain-containing protein [Cyclobacteriaceae bacterium]